MTMTKKTNQDRTVSSLTYTFVNIPVGPAIPFLGQSGARQLPIVSPGKSGVALTWTSFLSSLSLFYKAGSSSSAAAWLVGITRRALKHFQCPGVITGDSELMHHFLALGHQYFFILIFAFTKF